MKHKNLLFLPAVLLMMLMVAVPAIGKTPTKSNSDFAKAQKALTAAEIQTCYDCHETVKEFHSTGAHKAVNCISCHSGLPAHLEDSAKRPVHDFSWQACGSCHAEQMTTMLKPNYKRPARDDKSQPTNRSPIWFDKLMAPHGFTKEHAITRPHAFMLIDQFVVDRAFGGRFQPKNGWTYLLEKPGKVWDVLEDKYPNEPGQKVFLPQTATAANPVCPTCKTADLILDWAWMGDPGKGATFDRTSNIVQVAKSTNYGINCFFCHDPHSAKPRVIQNALIDALERQDTMYTRDPNRTKITVYTVGARGYDRKIAILDKPDSRLMCAQCHVEYSCNPGTNMHTGEPITFASPLTNHFPLVDGSDMFAYYQKSGFADFKHKITGAWLQKMQHPEFETYYEHKHSKLGVGCADCHMAPPSKKGGVTSHYVETPRNFLKQACLTANCHPTWTEQMATHSIESVKAYTKGRMRKAEYWLAMLIDKIQEGKVAGVSSQVLNDARLAHTEAHVLWEYWTAENSDGFHNPGMARANLTKSITISQNTIDAIDKAINDIIATRK